MEKTKKPMRTMSVLMAITSAVALSACGSDNNDGAQASASPPPTAVSPAGTAGLTKLYAGDYDPPPSTGPAAQKGKKVWFVSCGQAFEACSQMSNSFKAAGQKLGWNVNVVDGASNPATAGNLIKQAVAAKADGIAWVAYDCPGVKAALQMAANAKIPTTSWGSFDCNNALYGGKGAPLITAPLSARGTDGFSGWVKEYSAARADALYAHMGKPGKILDLEEQSQGVHKALTAAFKARLAEICASCQIVPVKYSFAQPPATWVQAFKGALLSNPDAAAMANDTDALMGLGLATALSQAKKKDLFVMGAEGAPSNLALIKKGVQGAALAVSGYDWQMWGMADSLNRVFSGTHDLPPEGGGWTLVDKDHNLPATGQDVVPKVDFKAAYQKIWAG